MTNLVTLIPLAARVMMSAVFVYSGVTKLIGFETTVAEVSGMGIPLPFVSAVGTIVVQLCAGIALLLNRFVVPACVLLAGFTVVATLLGHQFWRAEGDAFNREITTALEHLAIVGGFAALAYAHSLERRLR